MMSDYQPYNEPIRVRTNDLDAWNRLRARSLLSYMEQAATSASAAAGFGADWYAARQTAWLIRRARLLRLGNAAYAETLTATTWISTMARVRSTRQYEIRHADGTPVAVGDVEWVYIDRVRARPTAVDPDIIALFPLRDSSPLFAAWPEVPPGPTPAPPPPHAATRQAYRYEADTMGHVNNTIYADWLEEAAGDALRAWGTALAAPAAAGPRAEIAAITITYLRSAVPGDAVAITTTQTGADPAARRLALVQEIRAAGGSDVLVEAESIYQLS
jgi:acyl-CoA thioesterase FadM